MVTLGFITSCSNATTLGAPIDTLAWPAVCVGLFVGLVQAVGLTFPEILLFMHNTASSTATTDLLQLPISC